MFAYKVRIICDYDKDSPIFCEHGIAAGRTHEEAVSNIKEMYGGDNILTLQIAPVGESDTILTLEQGDHVEEVSEALNWE